MVGRSRTTGLDEPVERFETDFPQVGRLRMMIFVNQSRSDEPRTPQLPFDRVSAELRARIESGEWSASEQLPSVVALAKHHKTSKATMQRVIHALADEGLLTVVAGWGTFRAEN
jgi:DNA-binding GntR family transcriptional regulator